MSRQVVVDLGGEVSRFELTRITREKLYGKKQRVVVDEEGEECVSAMLTRDGSALLPRGTTAYLYVTEEDDVVERADLVAVDNDGTPVEPVPSTLGVEQPLGDPVPPERILDHLITAVYALDDKEIGDTLRSALEAGSIFETRFNYRKGFEDFAAFLLKNEHGYFCLVGEEAALELLRRDAAAVDDEDDDDDPFADDLDFSMF